MTDSKFGIKVISAGFMLKEDSSKKFVNDSFVSVTGMFDTKRVYLEMS